MIALPQAPGGGVCDMLTDVSSGHFLGGRWARETGLFMMWPFVAVGFGSLCPQWGSGRVEGSIPVCLMSEDCYPVSLVVN